MDEEKGDRDGDAESHFFLNTEDDVGKDQIKQIQLRERIGGFSSKMGSNFNQKLQMEVTCPILSILDGGKETLLKKDSEKDFERDSEKEGEKRTLFLFEDTLLVTKRKDEMPSRKKEAFEGGSMKKGLQIESKISFDKMEVSVTPFQHSESHMESKIQIQSGDFVITLASSSSVASSLLALHTKFRHGMLHSQYRKMTLKNIRSLPSIECPIVSLSVKGMRPISLIFVQQTKTFLVIRKQKGSRIGHTQSNGNVEFESSIGDVTLSLSGVAIHPDEVDTMKKNLRDTNFSTSLATLPLSPSSPSSPPFTQQSLFPSSSSSSSSTFSSSSSSVAASFSSSSSSFSSLACDSSSSVTLYVDPSLHKYSTVTVTGPSAYYLTGRGETNSLNSFVQSIYSMKGT